MKLRCIKSVQMKGDEQYQAFTEGKEYNARKGTCQGLNGDPYEHVPVLRAKNDRGESHIIKHLEADELNEFFEIHFEAIK